MKNSLNEILSMMSRIDPSYVSEDGAGEGEVNQQETDFLKAKFDNVDASITPYDDNLHFPKMVEIIDNAYHSSEDDVLKTIDEIYNLYKGRNTPVGFNFNPGTLAYTVYNTLIMTLPPTTNEDSIKTGNLVENEDIDFGKFAPKKSINRTEIIKKMSDSIKTILMILVNKKLENPNFDIESLRGKFYEQVFQDTGMALDSAKLEIDKLYDKIKESVENISNSKNVRQGSNGDATKEINNAFAKILWYMGKNNLFFNTALIGQLGLKLNGKGEPEAASTGGTMGRIGKYDLGWNKKNADTGDMVHQFSFHNPTTAAKMSPTKSGRRGVQPNILRQYLTGEEYGRLRAYLYYSANSQKRGYSEEFRNYIFNGNCLSENRKILDYDMMKWDDPLYGEMVNDPNYITNSLRDLIKILSYDWRNKSVLNIRDEVTSNLSSTIKLSFNKQKGETVYETLQFIVDGVVNSHENADISSILNPIFFVDNNFSTLYLIFDYVLNYDSFGYIGERSVISFSDLVGNTPLETIADKSMDRKVKSMFPDTGLFKLGPDKSKVFGIVDYLKQTSSHIKISEIEAKKKGDGVEGKLRELCSDTMVTFIRNVLNANLPNGSDSANLNAAAEEIYYSDEKGEMLWDKINEGGYNGRDKEVSEMIGTMSFDLANKAASMVIEYQGPYHFCFSSNGVMSNTLKLEEINDKNRLDAYMRRRDDFIAFILNNPNYKTAEKENGLFELTGITFEQIQNDYTNSIKREFLEAFRSGRNVDKYGIEINEDFINGEIADTKYEKRETITEKTKLNSLQRWYLETTVWERELKDNAKIWQACKPSEKLNKKSKYGKYFNSRSLFIHISSKNIIENNGLNIQTISKNLENMSNGEGRKTKILKSFAYATRYGDYIPKYAMMKIDDLIQIQNLATLSQDKWTDLYKNSFKVMYFDNVDDTKALKDLLFNRYNEMGVALKITKTETYQRLQTEISKRLQKTKKLKESVNKSLFKEIIEEILKDEEH